LADERADVIHRMFKRWIRQYSPVSVYRPIRRVIFDIDTELEREQEVARRVLVAEGGNVDKPVARKLIQENPDYGERHNWSYDANGSPVDYDGIPNG